MKRKLAIVCTFMVIATAPVPVLAASLDSVVTQNESSGAVVQSETTGNTSGTSGTGGTIFDDVASQADMSEASEIAQKVATPLYKFTNIATQILFYLLTAFLPVNCMLELVYIAVPMLRTGETMQGQQGAQGGMMGGMNSGYGGMSGGYGGGYGSRGGYGGMSGGMMGGGMMGSSGYGQQGMQGQQGAEKTKLLCFPMSQEVIMIAASPDKVSSKLMTFAKESMIKLTVSVVIAVLFLTGVMTKLALTIGPAIANAISNASNMI